MVRTNKTSIADRISAPSIGDFFCFPVDSRNLRKQLGKLYKKKHIEPALISGRAYIVSSGSKAKGRSTVYALSSSLSGSQFWNAVQPENYVLEDKDIFSKDELKFKNNLRNINLIKGWYKFVGPGITKHINNQYFLKRDYGRYFTNISAMPSKWRKSLLCDETGDKLLSLDQKTSQLWFLYLKAIDWGVPNKELKKLSKFLISDLDFYSSVGQFSNVCRDDTKVHFCEWLNGWHHYNEHPMDSYMKSRFPNLRDKIVWLKKNYGKKYPGRQVKQLESNFKKEVLANCKFTITDVHDSYLVPSRYQDKFLFIIKQIFNIYFPMFQSINIDKFLKDESLNLEDIQEESIDCSSIYVAPSKDIKDNTVNTLQQFPFVCDKTSQQHRIRGPDPPPNRDITNEIIEDEVANLMKAMEQYAPN